MEVPVWQAALHNSLLDLQKKIIPLQLKFVLTTSAAVLLGIFALFAFYFMVPDAPLLELYWRVGSCCMPLLLGYGVLREATHFHEQLESCRSEIQATELELAAGDFAEWIRDYAPGFNQIQAGERWTGRDAELVIAHPRETYDAEWPQVRRTALMRTPTGAWFSLHGLIEDGRWTCSGFNIVPEKEMRKQLSAKPELLTRYREEPSFPAAARNAA